LTTLELFLLDFRKSNDFIVLARRGDDTAIEHLSIDARLNSLASFGCLLGKVLTGNGQRPSAKELTTFGKDLFDILFQGSLRTLYNRLPTGSVSIMILSDRAEIKAIPWEYLVTPDRQPSPHRDRSIIRVQPTCGIDSAKPKEFNKKLKVLFVSADPIDQEGVTWEDVASRINAALKARMPEETSLKIIEGATRQGVIDAITRETFDIFHFFGHGYEGKLILQNIKTGKSDSILASDLAVLLAGKEVQLAILSACLSGAGDYDDDFGVISTALIQTGIPAVIANQYSIPYKSISPFVGSVYSSLITYGDIDRAVADGRAALAVELADSTGNNAVVEWGIPTLYRLANAKQLFSARS
jgi:hypothetical protein